MKVWVLIEYGYPASYPWSGSDDLVKAIYASEEAAETAMNAEKGFRGRIDEFEVQE